MSRACRGRNLEDALRADDLVRRCRGAMTPREEPEKLAVLLQVLLAVLLMMLLQLAVLMLLAVPVLVMWAWWVSLLQEPRSEAAGWEAMVTQQPLEWLGQMLAQCRCLPLLTVLLTVLPTLQRVSWRAMPEFSWRSSASPKHHRSCHHLRHRLRLFWRAWVYRRWARASNLFLQRDDARGRLVHRPCSSRACRHRHQFLRTSR